ncbi:hypothetical protein KUTeg_018767 [Tegillarca granosa]|uniref:Uncharacterized protein n=1 Tax=Tegillarca granosa TaxID=220873 RepID=A0ABQ9EJB0_TEGGR|nr:hypothetical protein KUTeg_018767 [Tegillarca granosa]
MLNTKKVSEELDTHVETHTLLRCAKAYRSNVNTSDYVIWQSLQDLVREILCAPGKDGNYKVECLERKCHQCGVNCLRLSPLEEIKETETDKLISWQKYQYVNTGKKDKSGQQLKRLELVNISSPPGYMWEYLKKTPVVSNASVPSPMAERTVRLYNREVTTGPCVANS